jgi:hypothetical protein
MIKNEDVLLGLWHDFRSWHAPSVASLILYHIFLMAGLTSAKVSPHIVIHGSLIFGACGLCLSVPWTSRIFTLLCFEFANVDLSTLRWCVVMIMTKWSCIVGHAP